MSGIIIHKMATRFNGSLNLSFKSIKLSLNSLNGVIIVIQTTYSYQIFLDTISHQPNVQWFEKAIPPSHMSKTGNQSF